MPFAAALSTAGQTARAIEEVCAQALDYLLFAAFVNFTLQFFQAEVHHVVVV